MPTTLDGQSVSDLQQAQARQAVGQSIVDLLGRPLTENEAKEVQTWLTWIETWRLRDEAG